MWITKDNYYYIDDLSPHGIGVITTNKLFGDILSMSKADISSRLNIPDKIIASCHQKHTSNIGIADTTSDIYFEDTDAIITTNKSIALLIKTADCLPIIIYDSKSHVIANIHSGWKGTYDEIGIKTIDKMISTYGSSIDDIHILFGAGISAQKYQVGHEFYESFVDKFAHLKSSFCNSITNNTIDKQADNIANANSDNYKENPVRLISKSFILDNNSYYFDNQMFNYINFILHGIPSENIITNTLCTYTDKDFFSYRREPANPGRNATIVYFI